MASDLESQRRRLMVARGCRAQTLVAAQGCIQTSSVLWISVVDGEAPRRARRRLGQGFDAVVLDLHDGLDADALALAAGFVVGGGALVLRLPPEGEPPMGPPWLAVSSYERSDVGHRSWARLEQMVSVTAAPLGVVGPVRRAPLGTAEQSVLVKRLVNSWGRAQATRSVVLAGRGRGKSAALGLAIRELPRETNIVVTAGTRDAVVAVESHAGRDCFCSVEELIASPRPLDLIIVDEAARIPVATLQAIVNRYPTCHLAFASTTEGYEGTGRGFVLRFLRWLERLGPVHHHQLTKPIRWAEGCALEASVRSLLVMDAAPRSWGPPAAAPAISHEVLEPARLAGDEVLLRDVFGLLVHAHYRTTPSDLVRLLDAPNLALHVLRARGQVVAVNLIAREGGLSETMAQAVAAGRLRLRGHALADTLSSHGGQVEAGTMQIIRSVRIAVHPAWRRRGLGRRLAEAVHQTWSPDLFGTLFGAAPEVIRFRREQGYRLVRLGGSRGDRTGEPSVVMVFPKTERAHQMVQSMRSMLALDVPHQLRWLASTVPLSEELSASVCLRLETCRQVSVSEMMGALRGYVEGPRTSDSVAAALQWWAAEYDLSALSEEEREIVRLRLREYASWRHITAAVGLPSVRSTQRALKNAVRRTLSASA